MAKYRNKKKSFQTVKFKLSRKQMKSLKNYCKARKTTPTKLIKKNIRYYTENFSESMPKKFYATSNQLDMFKEPKSQDQTELF